MVARDLTRDVVRGLSTLEMEFVEASDNSWFKHHSSSMSGISYADTIFPAFAFIGGESPRTWYRSIGLIGLGLGFNTLRAIDLEQVMVAAKGKHATIQRRQRRRERLERIERRASRGMADSLLSLESFNEDEEIEEDEAIEEEKEEPEMKPLPPNYLRLPGVLQRTGVCSLLFNACLDINQQWTLSLWFPVTMGAAWSIISFYALSSRSVLRLDRPATTHTLSQPFANPKLSAQTQIDTYCFGAHRLYTPENDPEGLLTVLTTAITMWTGAKFIQYISSPSSSIVSAFALGTCSIGAGYGIAWALPNYMPLSKRFWTPSFVLVTSGTSVLKYVLGSLITNTLPTCIVHPIACMGQRSLDVYFCGGLLRKVLKEYGAQTTKEGSLWMRMKRWLNNSPIVTFIDKKHEWAADLVLVLGVEVILASTAVYLVKTGMRVIYY